MHAEADAPVAASRHGAAPQQAPRRRRRRRQHQQQQQRQQQQRLEPHGGETDVSRQLSNVACSTAADQDDSGGRAAACSVGAGALPRLPNALEELPCVARELLVNSSGHQRAHASGLGTEEVFVDQDVREQEEFLQQAADEAQLFVEECGVAEPSCGGNR